MTPKHDDAATEHGVKNELLKKMNEQLKKSLADMNVKISRLENEYSHEKYLF